MEKRYAGRVFGITGWHKYIRHNFVRKPDTLSDTDTNSMPDQESRIIPRRVQIVREDIIEKVIIANGGFIGNKHIWQHDQIIIVGDRDFDKEYLDTSIRLTLDEDILFSCHYFSAEAFVEYNNYGEYPHYYQGDPRIRRHEGLSYLATRGFKWPSIHEVPVTTRPTSNFENRQLAHPLRSKYGYSVGEGLSKRERHEALAWAVKPNELGLEEVVKHIASLVRLSQRRTDRQNAIDLWQNDLEWLYETYYKNSLHSFLWPG